jgi:hypothetical protein
MSIDLDSKTGTEIGKPEHDYFAEFANAVQSNWIIGDLLTFSKFGDFIAGREKKLIELGTRLIVHMPTLMAGWVRWEDGHPAEQLMGEVAKGFRPAKRADLGYLDKAAWETDEEGASRDPWQKTNYLVFSNPEIAQLYTFATKAKGGITAIGVLAKDYSDHCRQLPGEYPIVELARGSYPHSNRKIGEVRFPVFTVKSWVSRVGPDALLGGDSEGNPPKPEAEIPAPAKQETPAPKPAKKTQPAAPRI